MEKEKKKPNLLEVVLGGLGSLGYILFAIAVMAVIVRTLYLKLFARRIDAYFRRL